MNNKLVPLFNRMKVLPDIIESKSGLIIPKSVQRSEKKMTGVIVDLGDKVDFLKEGDRILFGEYAGFVRYEDENGEEVSESKGTKYMYMNEADAIAIYGGWKTCLKK